MLSAISTNRARQFRIDIVEHASTPEVRPFIVGTPLDPPTPILLPYPLTLMARQKYDFFAPRQSFNLLAMFQSPMMMIMVVGAVLVLAMPYIMVSVLWFRSSVSFLNSSSQKNLDPETLQEMQNQRGKLMDIQRPTRQSGARAPIASTESAADGATSSQSLGNKNRSGKSKRR